jgi:hypothetical protein
MNPREAPEARMTALTVIGWPCRVEVPNGVAHLVDQVGAAARSPRVSSRLASS